MVKKLLQKDNHVWHVALTDENLQKYKITLLENEVCTFLNCSIIHGKWTKQCVSKEISQALKVSFS